MHGKDAMLKQSCKFITENYLKYFESVPAKATSWHYPFGKCKDPAE